MCWRGWVTRSEWTGMGRASMKTVGIAVAALIGAVGASPSSAGTSTEGARLLVAGPVEAVDFANRTLTVLGQRVQAEAPDQFGIGSTIAIFGTMRIDGSIEVSAIQSRGLYVPGASSVFLSGKVQSAEPSLGRVVINGVSVDLTSIMSYGMFSPAVGDTLAVSGIQPVIRGRLVVSGVSAGGIAGTGVHGIAGTGLEKP